jgi:hypothetical protein
LNFFFLPCIIPLHLSSCTRWKSATVILPCTLHCYHSKWFDSSNWWCLSMSWDQCSSFFLEHFFL